MSRGKVARGIVLVRVVGVELGVERERRAQAELHARKGHPVELEVERRNPDGTLGAYDPRDVLELLSAQMLRDVVTFDFRFRNDGELTIRAPALEFRETRNERLFDGLMAQVVQSVPTRLKLEDAIIYPGDEVSINNARLSVECKRDTVFAGGDYKVGWKVFLDNSPPSSGEIDLASLVETARRQAVADR